MINLESKCFQELFNFLTIAQKINDISFWRETLKDPKSDGFLPIIKYGLTEDLFVKTKMGNISDWLIDVLEWRKNCLEPTLENDIGTLILYFLWENYSNSLINELRKARSESSIPNNGGILAYICGLKICLVIRYEIIYDTPRIKIVALIENPKTAFDFWGVIDQASPSARNELKNILSSGHKLIYHRGTLIHVDRRNDLEVFGPSIDTLLMAEILAQQILEENRQIKTALEVGCGNGLLTSMLVNYSRELKEIYTMDINFNAVVCTHRNIISTREKDLEIYYINGNFQKEFFNKKFDLVICNPPYISLPTNMKAISFGKDYYVAIADTKLLKQIIQSAPDLLNKNGALLLMVSSISIKDALSWMPSTCTYKMPLGDDGYEVLFDVEAVLNNVEWLSYLCKEEGVISRGSQYYHKLHPIWITQKQT